MPKFMTTLTIGLLLFSTASEASIRVQLERIDPSLSQCIKAMEKGVSLPKTSGDASDISTYHWFFYDKKLFRISFGTTIFRCRVSQFK